MLTFERNNQCAANAGDYSRTQCDPVHIDAAKSGAMPVPSTFYFVGKQKRCFTDKLAVLSPRWEHAQKSHDGQGDNNYPLLFCIHLLLMEYIQTPVIQIKTAMKYFMFRILPNLTMACQ
jgi:hypothetical protein